MTVRTGVCVVLLLRCVTLAERLPEVDVGDDTVAMMQIHSNMFSHRQQPPPAPSPAAAVAPVAEAALNLGLTPGQVAAGVASAIVASAGMDMEAAQDLISRLDVEGLADQLAEVFGDYSMDGDLDGEVDVSVRFDAPEALRVITSWLDNVAHVFADDGLSTASMLSTWLASAGRQPAKEDSPVEVAFLENPSMPEFPGALEGGYENVMTSFAKGVADVVNGTYKVRSDEEGGPIEVNLRLNSVGLLGMFSSWLGDLATSFEAVGVRDALVRSGVGPEEDATQEERRRLVVALLGQRVQLSHSSAVVANEARERAVGMVRSLLAQMLRRSQAKAESDDGLRAAVNPKRGSSKRLTVM